MTTVSAPMLRQSEDVEFEFFSVGAQPPQDKYEDSSSSSPSPLIEVPFIASRGLRAGRSQWSPPAHRSLGRSGQRSSRAGVGAPGQAAATLALTRPAFGWIIRCGRGPTPSSAASTRQRLQVKRGALPDQSPILGPVEPLPVRLVRDREEDRMHGDGRGDTTRAYTCSAGGAGAVKTFDPLAGTTGGTAAVPGSAVVTALDVILGAAGTVNLDDIEVSGIIVRDFRTFTPGAPFRLRVAACRPSWQGGSSCPLEDRRTNTCSPANVVFLASGVAPSCRARQNRFGAVVIPTRVDQGGARSAD